MYQQEVPKSQSDSTLLDGSCCSESSSSAIAAGCSSSDDSAEDRGVDMSSPPSSTHLLPLPAAAWRKSDVSADQSTASNKGKHTKRSRKNRMAWTHPPWMAREEAITTNQARDTNDFQSVRPRFLVRK